VLPALAAAGFASMASVRIADSMLPALARDFGVEVSRVSPVIVLFALAYGVMQLLWGPLGDRVGKLRVIGWAALAASLGSVACALAPSLPALSAARLATGGLCAAIIPLSIAFVGDTVAYAVRQATLARLATGTLTGLIAGQVFGGLAADTLGWRTAFAALAGVFVVAGVLALRLHARVASPAAQSPPRSLLQGWWSVLRCRGAPALLAAAAAEGALVFGALAFVPTFLHEQAGMTLAAAGLAVAAVGAGGLVFATTARHWIARLGERGLVAAGGVLFAAGLGTILAAAALGGPLAAWAGAIAGCTAAGLGFYMLHNTLQTFATQVAPHARATAVGLFAVAIFVGQAAGVAAIAWLGPWLGWAPLIAGCGVLLALLGGAVRAGLARRPA
jgi:YNFM family putative membrane transporter